MYACEYIHSMSQLSKVDRLPFRLSISIRNHIGYVGMTQVAVSLSLGKSLKAD